jgi:predicted dehydrogenase
MIGAGVIGLGVGEQHVNAYAAHPDSAVTMVCDRDEARLAALRERVPGVRTTTDASALIADPGVQLVSIASYDDDHFTQVLTALQAGKHVFCEKPVCRSLDETRALAAARGARQLGSNLVLRAAPAYAWLREQVAAGALGTPYAFDGDYLYGRLHKITDGWRRHVEDYSVMLGGGIHMVDLMLWILGERPVTVSAVGNGIATAGTDFRYDDFVAATFTFPSGLIGRISANFGSVHRHQHVVRLFGTEATFVTDDAGPRWHPGRDGGAPAHPLELATLPATKSDLAYAFVTDVTTGTPHAGTNEHLDAVAVCAAADLSLRCGATVDIDYP